ncbi:MAG: DNA polymerase III subunit alpha [Candidatus Dojkabacteria bacterium]|nr:DNA polymerase III subunit alpha [Candidatus Dojkabacteria bacterium]
MCNGKSKFALLHTHSHFSILDGMSTESEIVSRAKELGIEHVAITDHGNLYSLPFFYTKAKENGINPIIGVEFYYSPKDWKTNDSYHLLVLAINDEGVKNIYKLLTISTDQFYYKPKITKKDIFAHNAGLIVTTGCIASHFNYLVIKGDENEAEKELQSFYEVFGKRLVIEIQDHGLRNQSLVNEFWFRINKKYKLKMIATNDSHYTLKEDAVYHDYMLAIQTGKKVDDANRLRFVDDKNKLLSEFYIKSIDEMLEKRTFRENPELLYNAYEIGELCKYEDVRFDSKLKMPDFDTKGYTVDDYFKKLVYEKAKEKLKDKYEEYLDRLKYEIENIVKLGFSGYFLIVHNIVDSSKKRGILVGPGRGSAAGSLVCYVLGITSIDPIRYGLLFDRFINPERVSPPDIDIDFEDEQRGNVISYIKERFGDENTSNIVTFVKMGDKMAIRDVCRSLGIEAQQVNAFVDALGDFDIEDEKVFELPHLKKFFEKDKRFVQAIDVARKLEGRVRQTSVHASGIVIYKDKLYNILPLSVVVSGGEKTKVTSYDMAGVELTGLLKVDVLGLRSLNLVKNIIKSTNIDLDIYNIDTDQREVYDNIFSTGKTTGVFQFESEGMRNYLKKLKPDKIEDLIAMNALYRPGPMKFVDNYINRKHGKESYSTYDERLRDILDETYGIMVYQEQIMQIFKRITNSSLAKADLMRRAIGKKKREIIDKMRSEFIEMGVMNGYDKDLLERIYSDIESFADYGFNKSHAAAYSYLAYVMAYLKNKYPVDYFVELANSHEGDLEKVAFCIQKAREEHDIKTVLPHILKSSGNHKKDNNKIIFGLYHIRGVKKSAIDEMIKYNKHKPINSFSKLVMFFEESEQLDIKTIEGLFWSGAFMFDKEYRSEKNFETIKKLYEASKKKKVKIKRSFSLFDFAEEKSEDELIQVNLDFGKDIDKKVIFDKEIHFIGLPLSFDDYIALDFRFRDMIKLKDNKFSGQILGFIYELKRNVSKSGKVYYNITLIDSQNYKKYGIYFGELEEIEFLTLCFLNVKYEAAENRYNLYINSIEKVKNLKQATDFISKLKQEEKQEENNSKDNSPKHQEAQEKKDNNQFNQKESFSYETKESSNLNIKSNKESVELKVNQSEPIKIREKNYKADKRIAIFRLDREDISEEDLSILNLYLNSGFIFINEITENEKTIAKVFEMILHMIKSEIEDQNFDSAKFLIVKASLIITGYPRIQNLSSAIHELNKLIRKFNEVISNLFF